jgi:hypothetical protein
MVEPAAKRDAVAHLRGVLEMSERLARSLMPPRKMIRHRFRQHSIPAAAALLNHVSEFQRR